MISLTFAQSHLLHFIEAYIAENDGVAPSFDEMRAEVGIASKSGIHRLVTALEERGYIRRIPNRSRAIEIVKEQVERPAISTFSTGELIAELARRSNEKRRAA